jgi:hypothetical protein
MKQRPYECNTANKKDILYLNVSGLTLFDVLMTITDIILQNTSYDL